MAIEEAVAKGLGGLADIGFGLYDRWNQDKKERQRKRAVENTVQQTESDYNKMLSLLDQWRNSQTDLASPTARARYEDIISNYDPNEFVYDFDKFEFTDENGKPITRDDYIAKNRDEILQAVTDKLQHTAAGAGLGRGTGAALGIAEGVADKDEELLEMANEQFGQDRSQAYTEWSDYINKMQSKLDKQNQGNLAYAELAGNAIQQDKAQESDYMADLLSLLQNKNASINQANLALI